MSNVIEVLRTAQRAEDALRAIDRRRNLSGWRAVNITRAYATVGISHHAASAQFSDECLSSLRTNHGVCDVLSSFNAEQCDCGCHA